MIDKRKKKCFRGLAILSIFLMGSSIKIKNLDMGFGINLIRI